MSSGSRGDPVLSRALEAEQALSRLREQLHRTETERNKFKAEVGRLKGQQREASREPPAPQHHNEPKINNLSSRARWTQEADILEGWMSRWAPGLWVELMLRVLKRQKTADGEDFKTDFTFPFFAQAFTRLL